jgi:hypothetical protein
LVVDILNDSLASKLHLSWCTTFEFVVSDRLFASMYLDLVLLCVSQPIEERGANLQMQTKEYMHSVGLLDMFCSICIIGAWRHMGAWFSASSEEVLTILSGDFNFVEHELDRWNLQVGVWSGAKDAGEADVFKTEVRQPFGLAEWEQGHFTHENVTARSRIDRMYCYQHLSMQIDRHIQCAVLEWDRR